MLAHLPRALLVLCAVAALSGCRFGDARFESDLPGRTFDPGGTVFTYIDGHDDALVEDENPRVVVGMAWVVFDPDGDLSDLEGSELADVSHELVLRDALALVFNLQSEVEAGQSYTSVLEAGSEQGDGRMTARIHLAPERLSADSTYADVESIASRRTTTVTLDVADFFELQELRGKIDIAFERTDNDPVDARTGTFSGTFFAPFAGERQAEANLALLKAKQVIGLPLGARSGS